MHRTWELKKRNHVVASQVFWNGHDSFIGMKAWNKFRGNPRKPQSWLFVRRIKSPPCCCVGLISHQKAFNFLETYPCESISQISVKQDEFVLRTDCEPPQLLTRFEFLFICAKELTSDKKTSHMKITCDCDGSWAGPFLHCCSSFLLRSLFLFT